MFYLLLVLAADDVIDEAVLQCLLCGEPPVTVGVLLDLFQGLSGVLGDQLCHLPLGLGELLSLDGDVCGGTTDTGRRLVCIIIRACGRA